MALDDAEMATASGQRDWGRYVYAGLAVALVAAVFVYVRQIDQALAETIDAPTGQPIKAVEID